MALIDLKTEASSDVAIDLDECAGILFGRRSVAVLLMLDKQRLVDFKQGRLVDE